MALPFAADTSATGTPGPEAPVSEAPSLLLDILIGFILLLGIYSAPDTFLPLDFRSYFFPVVGAEPSKRVDDPPAIRFILTPVGDTYRRFGHKVPVVNSPSYTHD